MVSVKIECLSPKAHQTDETIFSWWSYKGYALDPLKMWPPKTLKRKLGPYILYINLRIVNTATNLRHRTLMAVIFELYFALNLRIVPAFSPGYFDLHRRFFFLGQIWKREGVRIFLVAQSYYRVFFCVAGQRWSQAVWWGQNHRYNKCLWSMFVLVKISFWSERESFFPE